MDGVMEPSRPSERMGLQDGSRLEDLQRDGGRSGLLDSATRQESCSFRVMASESTMAEVMHERGVLPYIDAVGIHGFPSSPEFAWRGWEQEVREVKELLAEFESVRNFGSLRLAFRHGGATSRRKFAGLPM